MTDAVHALYNAMILDHARSPRNHGPLTGATHVGQRKNTLCGDTVTLYLAVEGSDIVAAAFEGQGCSLCLASASMLTMWARNRNVSQAGKRAQALMAWYRHGTGEAGMSHLDAGEEALGLQALASVRAFPSRIQCVTLPWEALHDALSGDDGPR